MKQILTVMVLYLLYQVFSPAICKTVQQLSDAPLIRSKLHRENNENKAKITCFS